jgi:hypothetical protein
MFSKAAGERKSGPGSLFAPFGAMPRPAVWAVLATTAWLVLVLTYAAGYLAVTSGTVMRGMVFLDAVFLLLALVLPLGLIWLAAGLAVALRDQRDIAAALSERTGPLVTELDATRRALAVNQVGASDAVEQTIRTMIQTRQRSEADLSETLMRLTNSQARLQATLSALLEGLAADPATDNEADHADGAPEPVQAAPRPRRPETPAPSRMRREDSNEEPCLPLLPDGVEEPSRPDWQDLVKALDFPRDDQDFEGFRALQAVLRYHPLAQMLQSAEDVLTLLSQEGVYMEDLSIESGDPVHWRRFMAGERGAAVASVGGIVDEQALDLTRALMKSDPIFRDTALFFQRRFDRVLQDFAREAGDQEIIDVANTRSGRAFMLLTRITGTFD